MAKEVADEAEGSQGRPSMGGLAAKVVWLLAGYRIQRRDIKNPFEAHSRVVLSLEVPRAKNLICFFCFY